MDFTADATYKKMQPVSDIIKTFGNRIAKTENIKCSFCDTVFPSPYLRTPAGDFPIYTECEPHRGSYKNFTPNYNPKVIRTEEQWNKICPLQYRNTDITRLPDHLKKLIATVEYTPKGLILVGASGTFKTRTMYLFLEKMFLQNHYGVKVFDGISFAYQMQEAFTEKEPETWIHSLARVDCLYFDDLNQFVFTDRAEQVLYQIIELRMQREKPTYYSSNLASKELMQRFSGSRGNAILRRIVDSCDTIIV